MTPPAVESFRRFSSDGRLEHLGGLDGLRGIAVALVVCFHGNWSWARGGFVGVSVFFTLSGFLITSLLLAERRHRSHISLGSFWRRRFGRLLPAAWMTIIATTIAAVALDRFGTSERGDALASLAQVANWRFLAAGASYGDIFAAPSPFRHFWSLAIEEQIYLVLPLIIAVVLARSRNSHRVLGAVVAALFAVCVGVVLTSGSVDRIYYGTDTRAPELLVGVLAAIALAQPGVRSALSERRSGQVALGVGGVVSAALVVWATLVVEAGSAFVASGGMVGVGVVSSVLVVAAASGQGPVAVVCSLRPLRWLGRISYGVYLFHWPLLVFLTERRTGLSHGPRFVLIVVITLVLAELSARFVEGPIRSVVTAGGAKVTTIGIVAALGCVALLLLVPTVAVESGPTQEAAERFDTSYAEAVYEQAESEPGVWGTLGEETPVIAMFGDSVAFSLSYQLSHWSQTTHEGLFLGGDVRLGCGIGRGGWEDGTEVMRRDAVCADWPTRWGALTDTVDLDIALVHTGQWEIVDRRLSDDGDWVSVGDPAYDAYLLAELSDAQELLSRNGALVIWVTLPTYGTLDTENQPDGIRRSHAPERVRRFNELLGELAQRYPDSARVLDLADYMADKTNDTGLRPDGSHFSEQGNDEFALGYLGPTLVDTWRSWKSDTLPAGADDQ